VMNSVHHRVSGDARSEWLSERRFFPPDARILPLAPMFFFSTPRGGSSPGECRLEGWFLVSPLGSSSLSCAELGVCFPMGLPRFPKHHCSPGSDERFATLPSIGILPLVPVLPAFFFRSLTLQFVYPYLPLFRSHLSGLKASRVSAVWCNFLLLSTFLAPFSFLAAPS